MNFMLIGEFYANWTFFAIFFYFCFVSLPQMGIEKTPIT